MQDVKLFFLPGCELVFKTLSTDGRDYHSEMNYAYLKPSSCKVFQSLYFDNFKEWFFSKLTRNFLIETYSFFEKNPTTTLLIKSLYYGFSFVHVDLHIAAN
jgi:hypothetical protein